MKTDGGQCKPQCGTERKKDGKMEDRHKLLNSDQAVVFDVFVHLSHFCYLNISAK